MAKKRKVVAREATAKQKQAVGFIARFLLSNIDDLRGDGAFPTSEGLDYRTVEDVAQRIILEVESEAIL